MKNNNRLTVLAGLVALFVTGCDSSSGRPADAGAEPEDGVATVYVVNYPLAYFAERIGGEHVRVVFPAPAGEDPAFWKPDAKTITAYQQADLILLNGASYAKWTKTVSLPRSKFVNTSAGVADQYIAVEQAVSHAHGPGGDHAHAGIAFTTWLDPEIALAQAAGVQRALSHTRPRHEDEFQENYLALEKDLKALDRDLSAAVKSQPERAIVFSHPVYQYLQRSYGLNGKSVHWEPEEVPPQPMWDELAEMLKQHPAKWMVWEGAPSPENVKRLADLGVQSTVFDPCGNQPEEGDFLAAMRRNTENLRRVFAE